MKKSILLARDNRGGYDLISEGRVVASFAPHAGCKRRALIAAKGMGYAVVKS